MLCNFLYHILALEVESVAGGEAESGRRVLGGVELGDEEGEGEGDGDDVVDISTLAPVLTVWKACGPGPKTFVHKPEELA